MLLLCPQNSLPPLPPPRPRPLLQSFVYGNSLRSQLVAIVVPDPEYLLPWAKERGLGQDLKQVQAGGGAVRGGRG